jgi:hypothetical protein
MDQVVLQNLVPHRDERGRSVVNNEHAFLRQKPFDEPVESPLIDRTIYLRILLQTDHPFFSETDHLFSRQTDQCSLVKAISVLL